MENLIPREDKGRLRFNIDKQKWEWIYSGPYFHIEHLKSGNWRVVRVKTRWARHDEDLR